MTSFIALLLATPLSIAIALFLTEISCQVDPRPGRGADRVARRDPERVLGLWGILVFGPWLAQHLEPLLEKYFGFLPIFEWRTLFRGDLWRPSS